MVSSEEELTTAGEASSSTTDAASPMPHLRDACKEASLFSLQDANPEDLRNGHIRNDVQRFFKRKSGDRWLLKKALIPPEKNASLIAQVKAFIEVFSSLFYRALLGPACVPKYRLLTNSDGEFLSISKEMLTFQSVYTLFSTGPRHSETFRTLLESQMRNFFLLNAVSYWLCEYDGNVTNWGFNSETKDLVRIDFDLSLCLVKPAFLRELKDHSTLSRGRLQCSIDTLTAKYFPTDHRALISDIRAIPTLVAAKPNKWYKNLPSGVEPSLPSDYDSQINCILGSLPSDEVFRLKYTAWLKILFISDDMIARMGRACRLSDDPDNPIRILSDVSEHFIQERRDKIEQALLSLSEFQDFLLDHGETAFFEIQAEFREYNRTLKSDRAAFEVSEEWLTSKFRQLYETVRQNRQPYGYGLQ